jgi:hypothetical protein
MTINGGEVYAHLVRDVREGTYSPIALHARPFGGDEVTAKGAQGATRDCRLLPVLSGRSRLGGAQWSYGTEQSIDLLVRTCREVQRVRTGVAAATECQSPQAVDSQWIAVRILQLIDERAVIVEDIDSAIAEVANQDFAAEAAECKRCARDSPGRVERPSAGEAAQQVAVCIEYIDESVTVACNIVVLLIVLLRIGDEKVAIDVRDAKRRVAGRDVRVGEAAVRRRGREQAVRTAARPEYIDPTRAEVRRKQESSFRVHTKDQSLVDGPAGDGWRGRVIDRDHGVGRRIQPTGPGGNRAVLGREDECGRDRGTWHEKRR